MLIYSDVRAIRGSFFSDPFPRFNIDFSFVEVVVLSDGGLCRYQRKLATKGVFTPGH